MIKNVSIEKELKFLSQHISKKPDFKKLKEVKRSLREKGISLYGFDAYDEEERSSVSDMRLRTFSLVMNRDCGRPKFLSIFRTNDDENDNKEFPYMADDRRNFNFYEYRSKSFPLICEVNITNNKSMSYITLFRFHMKTFSKMVDFVNDEFKLYDERSRCLHDDFSRNIEYDFSSRYPGRNLVSLRIKNENGMRLGHIDFMMYIVQLKENSRLLITGKSVSSKNRKSMKFLLERYLMSGLYHKIIQTRPKSTIDIKTRLENMIGLYQSNNFSSFIMKSEKLIIFMKKKFLGHKKVKITEPYRLLLPSERYKIYQETIEYHKKKKEKYEKKKKKKKKKQKNKKNEEEEDSEEKDFEIGDFDSVSPRVIPVTSIYELWMKIVERELKDEEKLSKTKCSTIGTFGIDSNLFLSFFGRFISSLLVNEDYYRAFCYSVKSMLFIWYHTIRNEIAWICRSRYFSSVIGYLSKIQAEEDRILSSSSSSISSSSIPKNYVRESVYIKELLNNVKPEQNRIHNVFKHANEILMLEEEEKLSIGKNVENIVYWDDSPISSEKIPFLFETVFLHLLRIQMMKSKKKMKKRLLYYYNDPAFNMVYQMCFTRRFNSKNSTVGFDFFIFRPFYRFLNSSNPFLINQEEELRVYDIFVKHVLSRHFSEFVECIKQKFIKHKENKNEYNIILEEMNFSKYDKRRRKSSRSLSHKKVFVIKPCFAFYSLGIFLRIRGEFELALKYLNLAKKEDINDLRFSSAKFHLLMEMGKYDLALAEARWIFLIAKRKNQKKRNSFIDYDIVLDILTRKKKKEKKKKRKEENDDNGLIIREKNIDFFRIPCPFQNDSYVVIGELKSVKDEEKDEINEESISYINLYDQLLVSSLRKLKKYQRKSVIRRKDLSLVRVLYNLPVISFLQKDFKRLESWILLLSNLEFCIKSYEIGKNHHHLYQIVANSYFLNVLRSNYSENEYSLNLFRDCYKKIKYSDDIQEEKETKEDLLINIREIYLVGGNEIIPFSYQSIEIEEVTYTFIPIFCKDIMCCDLFEGQCPTNNTSMKKKQSLLSIMKSKITEKKSLVIFMIGGFDLRSRIMNTQTEDDLHYFYNEEYQIDVLVDMLIRFTSYCNHIFEFEKVGIFPVFPVLNVIEKRRIYQELANKKNNFSVLCRNRYDLFNSSLERKCSVYSSSDDSKRKEKGRREKKKDNDNDDDDDDEKDGKRKKVISLSFLGKELSEFVLDEKKDDVEVKFNLGYGMCINPFSSDLFVEKIKNALISRFFV